MPPMISNQISFITFFVQLFHLTHIFLLLLLLCWRSKDEKIFSIAKTLSHQKSKSSLNCTVSLLFLRNFATFFIHSSYPCHPEHSLLLPLSYHTEYFITTVVSVGLLSSHLYVFVKTVHSQFPFRLWMRQCVNDLIWCATSLTCMLSFKHLGERRKHCHARDLVGTFTLHDVRPPTWRTKLKVDKLSNFNPFDAHISEIWGGFQGILGR